MYLTKDKIIYKPNENLTVFPKTVKEVPGYTLLKTEGKDFKYGINNIPVYRIRSEKVENKETVSRIANYVETTYSYSKLQELYIKVLFHHLIKLYETVKVFPINHHRMELVNYLGITDRTIEFPAGYHVSKFIKPKIDNIDFDFTESIPIKITIHDYFQFQNEVPVICEKAVGETTYGSLGTPLLEEDIINLTLRKGRKL